jgi:hypothetical protein
MTRDNLAALISPHGHIDISTGLILRADAATVIVCNKSLAALDPAIESLIGVVNKTASSLEGLYRGDITLNDGQYEEYCAPFFDHIILHCHKPVLLYTQKYMECLNEFAMPRVLKHAQKGWAETFGTFTKGDKCLHAFMDALPRTSEDLLEHAISVVQRVYAQLKIQAKNVLKALQSGDSSAAIKPLQFICHNSTIITSSRWVEGKVQSYLATQLLNDQNATSQWRRNWSELRRQAQKLEQYDNAVEHIVNGLRPYEHRQLFLKGLAVEVYTERPEWEDKEYHLDGGFQYKRVHDLGF